MKHGCKRQFGRYVPAFSWHQSVRNFLDQVVIERPLLNVCSGPVTDFGDVRVDKYVTPVTPGVMADWTSLRFASDSFGAVFADPPWNLSQMKTCADFCKEAMRVAPVLYLMAPWLWVNKDAARTRVWIRESPGVNVPVLLVRYERRAL